MDPLGYIIGGIGILIALWQGNERKKLIRLARSQSWFLYSKANNMTGIVQTAQRKFIEKYSSNLDNEVCNLLSKSTAFGLEMFRETIRLIQVSEPKFNFKTIDLWQRQGKIDPDHKQLFIELVVEDKDDKPNLTDNTSHDSISH
jgi:hypothetical protein